MVSTPLYYRLENYPTHMDGISASCFINAKIARRGACGRIPIATVAAKIRGILRGRLCVAVWCARSQPHGSRALSHALSRTVCKARTGEDYMDGIKDCLVRSLIVVN